MDNQKPSPAITPSPWTIYDCDDGDAKDEPSTDIIMATVGDENFDIAIVSNDRPFSERKANAILIAAAPDLRSASQKLYDAIQAYLIDVPDRDLPPDVVDAFDAMEAAWQKADGTTPEITVDANALAQEVLDAFGEILVRHFPEAKTGDLSPLCTIALIAAIEIATTEWIENNVLPRNHGNAA